MVRFVPITDVCDFMGGTQPPKSEWSKIKSEGFVRMLQIRDFTQQDKNYVEFVKDSSKLNKCNSSDILIGRYGASIGKILTGLSGAYNVAIVKTIPDPQKLIKQFLKYILEDNNFQSFIKNIGSRAAQAGFNKAELKKFNIPLPSLETQKKIAVILDKADELRQNDKKILEKYDQLAQSVFLEMFGDPVKNEKKWEILPLNIVSNQITDGTHDTPKRIPTGMKFITGKHIRPFKIDYVNSDYVSEKDHLEIIKRCLPEYEDVLYTNIGVNLGTAAMNTVDYIFSMKNVALIKYKRNILHGRFLESLLNAKNMKSEILRMASLGGAQQFLSLAQIRALNIPVPPLKNQTQFAKVFDQIECQKQITQESLKKSEDLFQSLLQRAFKGDLE